MAVAVAAKGRYIYVHVQTQELHIATALIGSGSMVKLAKHARRKTILPTAWSQAQELKFRKHVAEVKRDLIFFFIKKTYLACCFRH